MNWEVTALIVLGSVGSLIPFATVWYRDRKARKQSEPAGSEVSELAKAQEAAVVEAMALLAAKARRWR